VFLRFPEHTTENVTAETPPLWHWKMGSYYYDSNLPEIYVTDAVVSVNNSVNAPWHSAFVPDGLNLHQILLILIVLISAVFFLALYSTCFTKPLKLLAVFVHECMHLFAGVLVCNSVVSMRVDADEGGETELRGGCRGCTLPAGYLGSSIAGAVLIVTAARETSALVSSAAMCVLVAIACVFARSGCTLFLALLLISR